MLLILDLSERKFFFREGSAFGKRKFPLCFPPAIWDIADLTPGLNVKIRFLLPPANSFGEEYDILDYFDVSFVQNELWERTTSSTPYCAHGLHVAPPSGVDLFPCVLNSAEKALTRSLSFAKLKITFKQSSNERFSLDSFYGISTNSTAKLNIHFEVCKYWRYHAYI